jgi:uncharacterized membrane protein
MQNFDLFTWWAISISWGIVFLILVSIYLYANGRPKRKESNKAGPKRFKFGKAFAFVWVLIGLLFFYIASVSIGSATIFAAGNIIVESILIVYLVKNRCEKSDEKSDSQSQ